MPVEEQWVTIRKKKKIPEKQKSNVILEEKSIQMLQFLSIDLKPAKSLFLILSSLILKPPWLARQVEVSRFFFVLLTFSWATKHLGSRKKSTVHVWSSQGHDQVDASYNHAP